MNFQDNKQPITKEDLLKEAGKIIKNSDHYVDGIEATNVKSVNGTFVFSGEYYLREDGTPSEKTLAVFNVFKFLNEQLSQKYYLDE